MMVPVMQMVMVIVDTDDNMDSNDTNPYQFALMYDVDTCDDCSSGYLIILDDDGFDYDGDGLCDSW